MKTKSTIKLFATAILATAAICTSSVYADAQINRDASNDSVEIISDAYKTFEEADKALNNVKDKYLEEYGNYRAGVNPTEDLKHYEVYSVLYAVSTDQTSESTVQNVAKALSNSQLTAPTTPTAPAAPSETPVAPAAPAVPSETPTTPTVPANNSETPVAPSVDPSETPASPAAQVSPTAPTVDQNVPAVSNNSQSNLSTTPTTPTTPTTRTTRTKPVEDNSKPTLLQNSDAKPAQSIVALAGGKKEDSKPSKSEDPKQSNTAKKDESKTESSKKSDSSEPVKKGEDKLKELPNTGEGSSNLGIAGLMILSVLAGFFGFKKRNG